MDYNNKEMDNQMESPDTQEIDDIKIDDNVDEVFEQKMRKLKELGLYDNRMMQKLDIIKNLSEPLNLPNGHIKRGYQVLGRNSWRHEELQEFKGEEESEETGAQGFKPIENSGFKWSLPLGKKRNYQNSNEDKVRNNSDRYERRGHTSEGTSQGKGETNKRNRFDSMDEKQPKKIVPKFFDNCKQKVEKKVEMITDIEAFIADCNKKAEKPKPLILDDIDDFIERYNQKFDEISAKLDKNFS